MDNYQLDKKNTSQFFQGHDVIVTHLIAPVIWGQQKEIAYMTTWLDVKSTGVEYSLPIMLRLVEALTSLCFYRLSQLPVS